MTVQPLFGFLNFGEKPFTPSPDTDIACRSGGFLKPPSVLDGL